MITATLGSLATGRAPTSLGEAGSEASYLLLSMLRPPGLVDLEPRGPTGRRSPAGVPIAPGRPQPDGPKLEMYALMRGAVDGKTQIS